MRAVRVTVADVYGSAPREPGATMIVLADTTIGSVGGGALEYRAIAAAREMLADGATEQELRLPLGPTLKQCCGGYVVLRLQAGDDTAIEPFPIRHALTVYGAGHVGRATVAALSPLPFRILWVDGRAEAVPEHLPPEVTFRSADPRPTAAEAATGSLHAIMTHDHGLDLDLCTLLLPRPDLPYVGLIGSASKRARFRGQLAARGIAAGDVARLICPIGVTGIRGKQPPVIAASLAAELLLVVSRLAAAAEAPPRREVRR